MDNKSDDLEQGVVSGTLCDDDDDEVILGSNPHVSGTDFTANGSGAENRRPGSTSPVIQGRLVEEEAKDDPPIVRGTSSSPQPRGDIDMQIRASTYDIEASRARPASQRHLSHQNFSFRESFRDSNVSRREDPPNNFVGFMTNMGQLHKNPFQSWSRFEIVTVLINDGQEIRDEQYLSLSVLKSFADQVFADREIPDKPKHYSMAEMQRRNLAALKIQNFWFNMLIRRSEVGEGHAETRNGFTDLVEVAQHEYRQEMARRGVRVDEPENDVEEQNTILDEPWVPPCWEYARLYADYNHPREGGLGGKLMSLKTTTTGRHCTMGGCGEQCDMWEEKQVSELGRYGPGITNYFKFLKWLFWIFVILSIIYLPMIVINTFGKGQEQSVALNDLSQTMAGNLGDTNHTTRIQLPLCSEQDFHTNSCGLSKGDVATLYAYLDFFAIIIVLIAYFWLRAFEVREQVVLDKNSLSAANYTVAVKNLPTTTFTERDLMNHFVNVITLFLLPVTGQAVATVSIAYDNEAEIELYKRRGALIRERYRATQEYRYYKTLQTTGEKYVADDYLLDILDDRITITSKIRKIDKELEKISLLPSKPVYAFVTFERSVAARVAVRTYTKSLWQYCRMKENLKFKGAKLVVEPAPEASTIMWENLKYRMTMRARRRLFTNIVAIILIAMSAIANFAARALDQKASNHGGDEFCPDKWDDYTTAQQQQMVEQNEDLLHCYCDGMTTIEQQRDDYCKEYFQNNLEADLTTYYFIRFPHHPHVYFSYFAAFVVLVVNAAIDQFLQTCAMYEKHHSVDAMQQSIFFRMFLMKFLNTGVLFLFMNSVYVINNIVGVDADESGDFTTQWYQTVGVSIVLVQFGDIVSPHFYKLYKFYRSKQARKKAERNPLIALTQDELNALHLGDHFLVSHRYAQLMADFFVCLMFCTGMPILTLVGMMNFCVAYCVDKYLFLRFYRSPPRYGTEIGRMATGIIPFAVIIHLAIAIWTLGNKEIFATSESNNEYQSYVSGYDSFNVGEKIRQRHVFPLFCLFIVVSAGVVLKLLSEHFCFTVSKFVKTCFGTCMARYDFFQELERFLFTNINVSYSRAVRRGIIKGLASYNILQNPKYKEAFGISDTFALKHATVRSLRKLMRLNSLQDLADSEVDEPENPDRAATIASPDEINLANASRNIRRSEEHSMVELTSHGRAQQQLAAEGLTRGRRSDPTDLRAADTRQSLVLGSLAREEEMDRSVRSARHSDNTVTGRLVDSGTTAVSTGNNSMNQSSHVPRTSTATTRQTASTHGYPSRRGSNHTGTL